MTDQQFTHLTTDTLELLCINASALDRHLRRHVVTPEWIDLSEQQGRAIEKSNGIEERRMRELTDNCLSRPVIFCALQDNTHILVDGSHRLVYAYRKKRTEILGWLVEEPVWSKFVIDIASEINGVFGSVHNFVKITVGRDIPLDAHITIRSY